MINENRKKALSAIKRNAGFTLIELIVVIAVIAILASVMLPRFTGFTDSARYSAVRSDIRNYATGVSAVIAEGNTPAKTGTVGNVITIVGDLGGEIYFATVNSDGTIASTTPNGGDFYYTKPFNDGAINITGSYDYGTGEITVPVTVPGP